MLRVFASFSHSDPLGSTVAECQYTVGGSPATPTTAKESERVRARGFPRINGVSDWQTGARKGFRNASGRPAQAGDFVCAAEKLGVTFAELAYGGDFQILDYKLADVHGDTPQGPPPRYEISRSH